MDLVREATTATYCCLLNANGELMFGVGDHASHQLIHPQYVSSASLILIHPASTGPHADIITACHVFPAEFHLPQVVCNCSSSCLLSSLRFRAKSFKPAFVSFHEGRGRGIKSYHAPTVPEIFFCRHSSWAQSTFSCRNSATL